MPVRGVVGHEVKDDPYPTTMRFAQETVDVIKGPEDRVDGAVVHDVVAEIGHRRRIDRRNPDRVDA
jgi:hypothetical protein